MGNSTRCHAVIQCLTQSGHEVDVITSGNGMLYFSSHSNEIANIYEVQPLYYGSKDGRISIFRTLAAGYDFLKILKRNARLVTEVLEERRPDVVVIDSVYTYRPMKRMGIPIIAINNADGVHRGFYKYTSKPGSIFPQFFAIEEMDYLYHRIVPDLVVSPSLIPMDPARRGKFLSVGPLVRKGYEPTQKMPDSPLNLLIMLSNSRFGTPVNLSEVRNGVNVDIIGRAEPESWPGHDRITYHGKVMDNKDLVCATDLAVINCGFSAVTEMYALRKPILAVPVPNHAEQYMNARSLVELGVAQIATEDNFADIAHEMIDKIESFRSAYDALPPAEDGARLTADAIVATGLDYSK